jgi:hypothetical protein
MVTAADNEATKFLNGPTARHLTGDAAWEAYVALGGDGLAANHGGWIRRDCPAHTSRSGNSLVFKLDERAGIPTLIVSDFAGCKVRAILEAAGVDTAGLGELRETTPGEWLARGGHRPRSFPPFEDPAAPIANDARALAYFCGKRGFDVDVLRRAGVTAVQYPYRYWRERPLEVRARFPFACDGHLVGAWDRAILDVAPGGRRWIMAGTIPVPFGWDNLPAARGCGHVYVVEGPTDAAALAHALPGAAILGVGAGRSMWRPWWGPEFHDLTVWLLADNDSGGALTRKVAREVLGPYARGVVDVLIPRGHNDVDDWRRATGDRFHAALSDAMQRAALDGKKAA